MAAIGTAKALLRTAIHMALVPLFALYGLFFIASGASGLVRYAKRGVRLLGESLPCPSCRAPNALHGRWKCRACGASYHGFVGCCGLCGCGASFFPCARCGVSISLR